VGDVVQLMWSFERMYDSLISCLYRDEAMVLAPLEGLPHAQVGTSIIHRELKKVKFPEFFGTLDGATTEAWLENMEMCFSI
jgi:hypothetical protein